MGASSSSSRSSDGTMRMTESGDSVKMDEEASSSAAASSCDDGAGVHPRSMDDGDGVLPPAKRGRWRPASTTDLSDRHIHLCAQDAIMAVQRRVLGLQMVNRHTEQYNLASLPQLQSRGAASGADAPSSAAAGSSTAGSKCVLDSWTQRAFYDMLHGPLTALQHQTALRRHSACTSCSLSDVLRVSDLGQRVFLMVPMRWRGPFARVCRDWTEIARLCWQADEFELVKILQKVHLRNLGGPVAQLSSWVRTTQSKPIFFLLALSEGGRLEQMRIACKKAEPGLRRPDADDDTRLEHAKDWLLHDSVPPERVLGVSSQFVVTKHHAYCVVAVRGQALLVKLGGQTNGTHEHMYTDRFPARVTTMSMCPLDNNIIAFGVPVSAPVTDVGTTGASSADAVAQQQQQQQQPPLPPLSPLAGGSGGLAGSTDSLSAASPAGGSGGGGGSVLGGGGASALKGRVHQLIELVNFAQSSRIQTLVTAHVQPLLALDYSPDSEALLSVSSDAIQLWYRDGLEPRYMESRGPGAMDDKPERTLRMAEGTVLRIAKVHPAWTSALFATNESLEVRELRRVEIELPQLTSRGAPVADERSEPCTDTPLALKWRRPNIQVTAAAFVSHGNMLVVSDRGDRLLLLNYHGLQAAKRVLLPWAEPHWLSPTPTPPVRMDDEASGTAGATLDEGAGSSSAAHGGSLSGAERGLGPGGGLAGGGGASSYSSYCSVCTVTAIVECPDVAKTEEWRSGTSHLAVSSSRGDVVLIKI